MPPSELSERVAQWRHELHCCPEVGFEEHRTSAYVAGVLSGLGADVATDVGGAFGRADPACFTFLGNGVETGDGGTPLHSRDDDFNDEVLDTGVHVDVELVRSLLGDARPA